VILCNIIVQYWWVKLSILPLKLAIIIIIIIIIIIVIIIQLFAHTSKSNKPYYI
jgi:hypothetical protein